MTKGEKDLFGERAATRGLIQKKKNREKKGERKGGGSTHRENLSKKLLFRKRKGAPFDGVWGSPNAGKRGESVERKKTESEPEGKSLKSRRKSSTR